MSNELEDFIHNLANPEPFSVADGAVFLTGLKKYAEDISYEAEPAEESMEEGTGDPIDEMAAMEIDPVAIMANAAALAMKCQFNCIYYQEMARGVGRGELTETLRAASWAFCDDAKHLIRKIGVLTNGQGVPMPPVPTPEPTSDFKAILTAMQSCQQQYMVTLQTLHDAMPGDPMQHTLQHMIIAQQKNSDELARLEPTAGTDKTSGSKLAAAVQLVMDKLAAEEGSRAGERAMGLGTGATLAVQGEGWGKVVKGLRKGEGMEAIDRFSNRRVLASGAPVLAALAAKKYFDSREKKSAEPKPSPEATIVPPAGSEPMPDTIMRELGLALQQSEAEKQFLANRAQQAEAVAAENAAAAENAQAEAQLTAETAEAASAQAQDATLQAQEAMTAATQAEENAAAQAEGKMRLSMRIQQFRQQLADIVSQDPVGEEAMNFGEMAGAGSPMTANQQDAEMAQEEAMMAEAADPKAKKEVNQAQRAQTEAAQQTAQAQRAVGA